MRFRLLFLPVLFAASVFAQNSTRESHGGVVVPAAVEQKFVLEFPMAEAQWLKEGNNFKAKFINPVNNLGYIVVYDTSGRIVRREKELELAEVPAKITEYLRKNSRSQGVVVWSVTDSSGASNYYSPLPEGVVLFDKTGIPLSELNLLSDSIRPAASR